VEPEVNGPRKRGRPARIDRRQVVRTAVDLARDVGLENVQMAAVAERLGVRPSALNYHVADRQELLEAAAGQLADLRFPAGWKPSRRAGWRTWIKAWAAAFRAMLLAQPELAPFIKLTPGMATSLEDVDEFLGVLHRAGFEPEVVAKGTTFLAQAIIMSVHDELLPRDAGRHPQMAQLENMFDDLPAASLPNLRMYTGSIIHTGPDALFDFAVDCIVAGLEAHLPPTKRRR
jgi:AcrR family transcriptional regulator